MTGALQGFYSGFSRDNCGTPEGARLLIRKPRKSQHPHYFPLAEKHELRSLSRRILGPLPAGIPSLKSRSERFFPGPFIKSRKIQKT